MRTSHGLILLATSLAFGGCASVVTTTDGSTSGAGTGGTSAGTGGAPAGTTSSASTTTSTGAGGACPSACSSDAECQASCPASPNAVACCDALSSVCYAWTSGPTCPDPQPPPDICAPGGACQPGATCSGSVGECGASCSCDATGHYQCQSGLPPPACPAETPSCDAPCDSTLGLTCHCLSPDGDARACSCQGPPFKWYCAPAGDPCPPGVGDGIDCAQFADGQVCAKGFCGCHPACGTQVWSCLDI